MLPSAVTVPLQEPSCQVSTRSQQGRDLAEYGAVPVKSIQNSKDGPGRSTMLLL